MAILQRGVCFLGLTWWLAGIFSAACLADEPNRQVVADFEGNTYDRELWSIHRAGARVDPADGRLGVYIPPGPAGRGPVGIESRVRLEGDFTIRGAYRIGAMPMPAQDWINIEIFVEGPDGVATVMRTNHSKEGSGYSLWFEPPATSQAKGAWSQTESQDSLGELILSRKGEALSFAAANGAGSQRYELGTIPFGKQAITRVFFRVVVPETKSPVDVAWDDLQLSADRLIEPPRPSKSLFGRQGWLLFLIITLAGAGAVAAALWQRRQMRAR